MLHLLLPPLKAPPPLPPPQDLLPLQQTLQLHQPRRQLLKHLQMQI